MRLEMRDEGIREVELLENDRKGMERHDKRWW